MKLFLDTADVAEIQAPARDRQPNSNSFRPIG